MNEQSKKVKLCVIKHAELKNNRAHLLRTDITKSHLINRVCQHRGVKTNTVTPSFYHIFKISLSCNNSRRSFIENLWRVLLLGTHLLKYFSFMNKNVVFSSGKSNEGGEVSTKLDICNGTV